MGSGYEYALTGRFSEDKEGNENKVLKALKNNQKIYAITRDTGSLGEMSAQLLEINSVKSPDRRSEKLESFVYRSAYGNALAIVTHDCDRDFPQFTIEKAIKTLSIGEKLDRRQIERLSNIADRSQKFNTLADRSRDLLNSALTDAFNAEGIIDLEEKFGELVRLSFKGKKPQGLSL